MFKSQLISKLHPCSKCGSYDLEWCEISVRPYCRECNNWGYTNFGTSKDAINSWNERYEKLNEEEVKEENNLDIKELNDNLKEIINLLKENNKILKNIDFKVRYPQMKGLDFDGI